MPDPAQVAAAFDFLAGLGLEAPADLEKLLRVFPEALGLRVEVMADNVQVGAGVEVIRGAHLPVCRNRARAMRPVGAPGCGAPQSGAFHLSPSLLTPPHPTTSAHPPPHPTHTRASNTPHTNTRVPAFTRHPTPDCMPTPHPCLPAHPRRCSKTSGA